MNNNTTKEMEVFHVMKISVDFVNNGGFRKWVKENCADDNFGGCKSCKIPKIKAQATYLENELKYEIVNDCTYNVFTTKADVDKNEVWEKLERFERKLMQELIEEAAKNCKSKNHTK